MCTKSIYISIINKLCVLKDMGGRTGRTDGPGGRTGRTDGPGGRTDRAEGRTDRKRTLGNSNTIYYGFPCVRPVGASGGFFSGKKLSENITMHIY